MNDYNAKHIQIECCVKKKEGNLCIGLQTLVSVTK